MKKFFRRAISFLTAAAIILSLSISAIAAEIPKLEYIKFSKSPVGIFSSEKIGYLMVVPDGTSVSASEPKAAAFNGNNYSVFWIEGMNIEEYEGDYHLYPDYECNYTRMSWAEAEAEGEEADNLKWDTPYELYSDHVYSITVIGYTPGVERNKKYVDKTYGNGSSGRGMAYFAKEKVMVITETYEQKLKNEGIELTSLPKGATVDSAVFEKLLSTWAADNVTKAEIYCSDMNFNPRIMDSVSGTNDLRDNITREQFATLCVALYELMDNEYYAPMRGNEYNPFDDINGNNSYAVSAYRLGIVTGTSETTFSPNAPLTREQAAVMLTRLYKVLGEEVPTVAKTTFADDAKISAWAKSEVAYLASTKIIEGIGENRFNPQGNISCQEAITLAVRILNEWIPFVTIRQYI